MIELGVIPSTAIRNWHWKVVVRYVSTGAIYVSLLEVLVTQGGVRAGAGEREPRIVERYLSRGKRCELMVGES